MEINKIYNENCLVTMSRMPDNGIDLIVTSPPYDSTREYHGYVFEFETIAKELYRILKPTGILVWVVSDETKNFCESLSSFKQAVFFVENCGLNLLDTMIYEKNGGPSPYPNLKRYAPWFEYMFVFAKGKPGTFNPIKDQITKSGKGKMNKGNTARQKTGQTIPSGSYITQKYKMRSNIWKYDVGNNKDTKDTIAKTHPARFPEKLANDHIITWSNVGEVVYDPFMGSGTLAKMALKNNRKYIGSEISKDYCDMANQRIHTLYDGVSLD